MFRDLVLVRHCQSVLESGLYKRLLEIVMFIFRDYWNLEGLYLVRKLGCRILGNLLVSMDMTH